MRVWLVRITALASLGAAIACASTDDETLPVTPDGGDTMLGDGGSGDGPAEAADASVDDAPSNDGAPRDAAPPTCSEAGWCLTALPDTDLTVWDIQPFEKSAFAMGFSSPIGWKVLEYTEDLAQASGWSYIDDDTQQNIPGQVKNIWAPNRDEVYYTLQLSSTATTGSWGAYLYHGERPIPPATEWSWTSRRFDCSTSDVPVITGIGTDVYLLHCKKVYRLTGDPDADAGDAGDAGSPVWTVEYTDDDTASLVFKGIAGTQDEPLFVANRGPNYGCSSIVRKTADGYRRIADGIQTGKSPNFSCLPKSGLPVTPAFRDFSSVGPDAIVGTAGTTVAGGIAKVLFDADGGVSVVKSLPRPDVAAPFWAASTDELWLTANFGYLVLRGTDPWSDAGAYEFSTLAINGVPNGCQFQKMRGTSNSNIWGVGNYCAFHKTIP